MHTKDIEYKGYTFHASPNEPQYEIKKRQERPHRDAQRIRGGSALFMAA
jgi:hypothetical protein